MAKTARIIISGLALCSTIALAPEKSSFDELPSAYLFMHNFDDGYPMVSTKDQHPTATFGWVDSHEIGIEIDQHLQPTLFLGVIRNDNSHVIIPYIPLRTKDNGIQHADKPAKPADNPIVITAASYWKLQIALAPVIAFFTLYGIYKAAFELKDWYKARKETISRK